MRWAAVVLGLLIACKKQEPEPDPLATATASAKSKPREEVAEVVEGSGGGTAADASSPVDAGSTVDAPRFGGNGQPAMRDADGHVRGPGGPMYMGRGPDCTDKIDHCLREGVWFAVGNIQRGKLYRAKPVFAFESKWWTFTGDEYSDFSTLFKTRVADKPGDLKAGSPVVWLIEDNNARKWVNSEHDALTTSRWEVGIVKAVGGTTFEVDGWDYPIPTDTARTITEQKKAP
jgi:hypothetical protein